MHRYGLLFLFALASADNGFRSDHSRAHRIDFDNDKTFDRRQATSHINHLCKNRLLNVGWPERQNNQGYTTPVIKSQRRPHVHSYYIQLGTSPGNRHQPLRGANKDLPILGASLLTYQKYFDEVYQLLQPRLTMKNPSEADKSYITALYVLFDLFAALHRNSCFKPQANIDYQHEVDKAIAFTQHHPIASVQRPVYAMLSIFRETLAKLAEILNSSQVQEYCAKNNPTFCDSYIQDIIKTQYNDLYKSDVKLLRSVGLSSLKFLKKNEMFEALKTIPEVASFFHDHQKEVMILVDQFEDTFETFAPCNHSKLVN